MTPLPRVLVLMGGPDAERDISLMSGRAVADALRAAGRWEVIDRIIDDPAPEAVATLIAVAEPAVIVPMLHGTWGEGGPLQEILEDVGLPYVGSRPRAAALAMNKLAAKTLAAQVGVPSPPARQLEAGDACHLDPPLVLKPIDDGSSVDLRICRTRREVQAARAELHPKRGRLLAEQYIRGRELTVGIVTGEPLPVIEIIPAAKFYDYDAKYFRDDTRYDINPELPDDVAHQAREYSIAAYRRLGCRDIARADFMLDERGLWFLEINTMPGFTDHSLVPMAARSRGEDMAALCTRLVETALARAARPSNSVAAPARTTH